MTKFPYGPGNLPPTKQAVIAAECPMGCGKAAVVITSRPPETLGVWWSRCQRCLAYWETSPAGKVIVLKVVGAVALCPDCHWLLETTGHVCTIGKEA